MNQSINDDNMAIFNNINSYATMSFVSSFRAHIAGGNN